MSNLKQHLFAKLQLRRSQFQHGMTGVASSTYHKTEIMSLTSLGPHLEVLEQNHFQAHSECGHNSIPAVVGLNSLFPCWLSAS